MIFTFIYSALLVVLSNENRRSTPVGAKVNGSRFVSLIFHLSSLLFALYFLLCFSLFQHFLYVLAGMEYVVANTAGSYAKHVGYLATAIAFEPKGHDYRLPTGKVGYNVHYLLYVVPAVNIGHCGLAV